MNPPAAPIITAPASGSLTADDTPPLSGTATAGLQVEAFDTGGTASLGTATADGAGAWALDSAHLADGLHSITARARASDGQRSVASAAVEIVVDTLAPAPPGFTSPATGLTTRQTTLLVGGVAEAGATVSLLDTDGVTVLGTTTASGVGAWSVDVTLGEAVHSIAAFATDAAGNRSGASATLVVTVDLTPPASPVIRYPTAGLATNSASILVYCSGDAGAAVATFDTDGVTTLAIGSIGPGPCGSLVSLPEGPHTITVVAFDVAGNRSGPSAAVTFVADRTPPAVSVGNDIPATDVPVALDATVVDSTAIVSYQWTQTTGAPGAVRFSNDQVHDPVISASIDGTYTIRLTATDAAGNAGWDELQLAWQSTPPVLVARTPSASETNVAVDRAIRLAFSEPMATASFASGLSVLDGATPVTGTTTFDAGNKVVVFTPSGGLAASRTYQVRLSTAVTDAVGTPLAAAIAWTFTTAAAALPVVGAYYPANGAGWNDYVANDGATALVATGAACSGATSTGYATCLHGGEMRAVLVPGIAACGNLAAADALGAFDWVCAAAGGQVRMVSTGLKDGRNLSDLIDFSTLAWRPNSVTVTGTGPGLPFTTARSGSWWGNPVVVNNAGGPVTASSQITLVTENALTSWVLGADRIAFLVDPALGALQGPSQSVDMVAASGVKFLWIEGAFEPGAARGGVNWTGVRFSVLRHVRVQHTTDGTWGSGARLAAGTNSCRIVDLETLDTATYGLTLQGSTYNTLRNIRSHGNAWLYQISISSSSDFNTLDDVEVSNSKQTGISIYDASNNVLRSVRSDNNGSSAFSFERNSTGNRLVDFTAANNGGGAISIYGSSRNVIVGVTSVSNNGPAVSLSYQTSPYTYTSVDNVIANITGANAFDNLISAYNFVYDNVFINALAVASNGVWLYRGTGLATGADGNTFENLALTKTWSTISSTDCSGNRFTGVLLLGANSSCSITGGTNPGLVSGTCDNQGASDAVRTTGVDAMLAFVGSVTVDDPVNASDSLGAAASYPAIPYTFDWSGFASPLRGWGHAPAAGRWTTGAGRIFDYRLAAASGAVRGVLPVHLAGNAADVITHTWSDGSTVTFLRNAVEVLFDGAGNDNGLCESGETCIYTPNLGAYQGHGTLGSAGTFTNGTSLTGITLRRFPTNGL